MFPGAPVGSHPGVIKCYIHYQVHTSGPHAAEHQKQQEKAKLQTIWCILHTKPESTCGNSKLWSTHWETKLHLQSTGLILWVYLPGSWLHIFQRHSKFCLRHLGASSHVKLGKIWGSTGLKVHHGESRIWFFFQITLKWHKNSPLYFF